jgi:glycosyltransferase involved in cell wall biosynthesis
VIDRRGRVLMLLHKEYPIGEARATREARAAVVAGFDVDIVALRRPGEAQVELVDGATVYRVPFGHRRTRNVFRMAAEYGAFAVIATAMVAGLSLRRRYTAVHVHNPPDHLVLAAQPARIFGSRVIYDVHDIVGDLIDMRLHGRTAAVARRVARVSEQIAYALSDEVVTVHESYVDELRDRGNRRPTTIVMNAVDEAMLPTPAAPPGSRPAIVFHGTLTRWYGVDVLISAFAKVSAERPDATLEIYGDGDDLPALRSLAATLGVADRVQFSGSYLPQREVLARVAGAAAGVIPSRAVKHHSLALSAKLLEYVELGIPCVCADLMVNRKHFTAEEVRFFRPENVDDLAGALLEVLAEPAASARRAEKAHERAKAYRWSDQANRYVGLLAGCAEDRPSSREGE